MARNSQGRTWAPTASGQVALYGIKSRFKDGVDRGMLVLTNSTTSYRELFHGTGQWPAMSSKIRIMDADAKGGARLIPRVLEEDRGTWDVTDTDNPDEKLITLRLKDGTEFAKLVLLPKYWLEKRQPREGVFDPVD